MDKISTEYKSLFQPIDIGPVEIKNRIAMAPMNTLYADRACISEQQLAYYGARARGGVGLIITEAVVTSEWAYKQLYYNNLCLYDTEHVLGMNELVETIHAFGAKIFVQLCVGFGVQGSSHRFGVQPVAPSEARIEIVPEMLPKQIRKWADNIDPELLQKLAPHVLGELCRAMTLQEISDAVEALAKAAELADIAGFDGIEIHACHGYLMHDFLSPRFNKRNDEYGGTPENRRRFLMEVLRAARENTRSSMAVGIRASAQEHMPDGIVLEDTIELVQELEEAGADYFHLSDGSYEALRYFLPDTDGQMIDEAEQIKKATKMTVVTPSIHSPRKAAKAVSDGATDMVSEGRPLIADPQWAKKVKEGRVRDIVKCTRCYKGCIMNLLLGLSTRCTVNPESGNEKYNPDYWRISAI